ncbi:AzlD domain-containing protein [Salinirubrum litoreum]|uniref:AzlD domain-containing protein n=1 Tax=Salinirubrum litoreum TaxID=1126234 RepID=A0ABD5RDE9_9EURY
MVTEYGPTAIWLAVVAIGVVTFAFRASFVALFGYIDTVPPTLERALRYVPPAVLAALVAPDLLVVEPTLDGTLADGRLIAGLVAAGVAWRTEDLLWTIVAGMVALWLVRFLPGLV